MRVHYQADQVQQQPQRTNQYSHTYAQQNRAQGVLAPPPQVQPTNPLDMFDPFQNYPANPAPVPGVSRPLGNPSHGEALPDHQGGHDGDQAAVHDRVVAHGQ